MDKFVQGSLIAAGLSLVMLGGAATSSIAGSSPGVSAASEQIGSADVSSARKAKKSKAAQRRAQRARGAERRYGRGAPPAYRPGPGYGAAPAYGPAAAIYPGALRAGDPGYDTVGSIYYGPGAGPYGTNRVTGQVYSKCYSDLGYGRVEPCDHGGGGGLN